MRDGPEVVDIGSVVQENGGVIRFSISIESNIWFVGARELQPIHKREDTDCSLTSSCRTGEAHEM